MWFEKIKRYFDLGVWNVPMVINAVEKGKITPEECGLITGKYPGV